jgi:hypothetical protein
MEASAHRSSARPSPILIVARGAAAGLAATLVLSALSRVLPGLWNERPEEEKERDGKPPMPVDPEDREQVREWQARSQSPAAHQGPPEHRAGEPPTFTPAGALVRPQGPGPEGLAEQFAFKVASGVFDSDITPTMRPVGMATHLAYGSTWGALYGLIQGSVRGRPGLMGPLFGLLVYGIGPGWLVPRMKIMPSPREESPQRTSLLILGHVIYGTVVAETFDLLERPDGKDA